VITVAHLALVRAANYAPQGGSDAADAEWVSAAEALSEKLAFDHNQILNVGLARLRAKVRYAPIGLELMPETFTLAELRELYEALLGRPLDVSNFAKQAKATGVLRATGKKRSDGHRPAELYRFDRAAYAKQTALGVEFRL
jgi:8-oxo-dGTP diphosphatase